MNGRSPAKTAALSIKLVLLLLVAIGPVFAAALWLWPEAAPITGIGAVVGIATGIIAGMRASALLVAYFAVIGAVAVTFGTHPAVGAGIVALNAAALAFLHTRGYGLAMMQVAIFMPYLMPGLSTRSGEGSWLTNHWVIAGLSVVVLGVAGLWGAFLATRVTGRMHIKIPKTPIPASAAVTFGLTIGVLTTAYTWAALEWFPDTQWFWVLLTTYLMSRPVGRLLTGRIRDRIVGTIVGGIFAAGVFFIGLPAAAMSAVGLVLIAVAMTIFVEKRPYWVYASVLTPGVILFDGAGKNALVVDAERIGFTVAGIALAVIASVVTVKATRSIELRRSAASPAG